METFVWVHFWMNVIVVFLCFVCGAIRERDLTQNIAARETVMMARVIISSAFAAWAWVVLH